MTTYISGFRVEHAEPDDRSDAQESPIDSSEDILITLREPCGREWQFRLNPLMAIRLGSEMSSLSEIDIAAFNEAQT